MAAVSSHLHLIRTTWPLTVSFKSDCWMSGASVAILLKYIYKYIFIKKKKKNNRVIHLEKSSTVSRSLTTTVFCNYRILSFIYWVYQQKATFFFFCYCNYYFRKPRLCAPSAKHLRRQLRLVIAKEDGPLSRESIFIPWSRCLEFVQRFLLIEAFAGPTFAGQAAHAVKTDRLCRLGSQCLCQFCICWGVGRWGSLNQSRRKSGPTWKNPSSTCAFLQSQDSPDPTDRALQGQALSSETPQGEASRHAGGRGLSRP